MNLRRLVGIAILVYSNEAHVGCAQEETTSQDRTKTEIQDERAQADGQGSARESFPPPPMVDTLTEGLDSITREDAENTIPKDVDGFRSFAVYALSRGQGVPPDARKALSEARHLLERDRARDVILQIYETRIGIEGETRLCAEYRTSEAAGIAFRRISAIVEGRDLVRLVAEPCRPEPGLPNPERKES